jgi:hypothetical protein
MTIDQTPVRDQIKREMSNLFSLDARLVDELECALSVLLAILFAHMLHAANVSWAAYSGYMVMRGHVAESALRGVLRILGTCAAAGRRLHERPLHSSVGILLQPATPRKPPSLSACCRALRVSDSRNCRRAASL